MKKAEPSNLKKTFLISIPILFLLSAPLHFLFNLTGKLALIGAIVPVNESPWEHLKLAFFPIIVWWLFYFFRLRKEQVFSREIWLTGAAVSAFTSPLTVLLIFYFYKGAFGVEFLVIDILSLLIAVAAGQLLGYHVYKYSNPGKVVVYLSLTVIAILLAAFILFTFKTPHIPLFRDSNTGGFGIG